MYSQLEPRVPGICSVSRWENNDKFCRRSHRADRARQKRRFSPVICRNRLASKLTGISGAARASDPEGTPSSKHTAVFVPCEFRTHKGFPQTTESANPIIDSKYTAFYSHKRQSSAALTSLPFYFQSSRHHNRTSQTLYILSPPRSYI